jgi:hypothetical protein
MSVKDDWRAWLPEEKEQVFRSYVKQLEVSYSMLSVSLNEAIELRLNGRLGLAREALWVTPQLSERLAQPLVALLWTLGEHAKHYGTVPNATPLDPANFLGARGQRVARMNGLLSRILLSQRSQFLYKISALREMVEDLHLDYSAAAWELAAGTSVEPVVEWQAVDAAHYDLNTCLREAIVLLKCFLRVLPEDQLDAFQDSVRAQMRALELRKLHPSHRLIRPGRIASIAGE